MYNKPYENIRGIPANLTCGELMDIRNNLCDSIECLRKLDIETKQAICGVIWTAIEYKILKATNAHLGEIDARLKDIANNLEKAKNEADKHLTDTTNNLWSSSPQIPTITHNVNEFGHTPKRNSTPKLRHLLTSKAEKDIKALANFSRMFCNWLKNASPTQKPANIAFHYNGVMLEISFSVPHDKVYLRFEGLNTTKEMYSFPCKPSDAYHHFSNDFWHLYRRRMTKTIAKVMRDIDNNPSNWHCMEVKRGDLD